MTSIQISLTGTSPQRITGEAVLFRTASMWGIKRFTNSVPIDNSSSINVGVTSGELPITITTGSYFNWTLHPDQAESLSNFWVKGVSGDGLYIISY